MSSVTGKLVAIIEDDIPIQRMLESYLFETHETEAPECFSTIEDAISIMFERDETGAYKRHYDLIILDLKLPGRLKGLDFLQYLAQHEIPAVVLVFSAFIPVNEIDIMKYDRLDLLTVGYIAKPSELTNISKIIRRLMKEHSCKIVEKIKVPDLEKRVLNNEIEINLLKEKTLRNIIKKFSLNLVEDITSIETKHKIITGVIISLIVLTLTTILSIKFSHLGI